ncbi:MAG: XdhC family protein [Gammaproteobacteria bacterium]|jgi:xanthine dehydrogenase accessory factor
MIETDAVLDKAAELKARGAPFALVTVVRAESPTSAKPGAKAVVTADGEIEGWIGGGCAQPVVIKVVKQVLQDGAARLIRISPDRDEVLAEGIMDFNMSCHSGGTLDIFIDPVVARPALWIIGASPAAQALCGLAHRVGFAVTSAFPGADHALFPEADRVIDRLDGLEAAGSPAFVVVATQGKRDEAGLEAALSTGAGYIAFVASERKAGKLKQYLKERGHDAARVDAIISPAGVEIGAVTPEEIALSVLAGLVQVRRAGVMATTVVKPALKVAAQATGAAHGVSTTQAVEAIDPICGMSVTVATAEHRSEYAGHTYYFCCAGCKHSFDKEPQRYAEAAG